MNKLTVLIPTHAVKREVIGPLSGLKQKNATAPSTKLIEFVIENLKENIGDLISGIIIGLDHKIDDPISVEYLDNLTSLSDKYDNLKVSSVITKLSNNPMTTVTATKNFHNLIDTCETEYFLLWEHDWIFTGQVDTNQMKIWDRNIDMLRFNQRENISFTGHENIFETSTGLKTTLYSNNPFVCSKSIWNSLYKPLANNIPDWWGEYGAFVEGPINRHLSSFPEDRTKYHIHLYGKINDPPVIAHLNGQVWR